MIWCTVEKKPVESRCNASCARSLGCYSTRWRNIKDAPKDGTPIMAIATRLGWPGNGARVAVVWSFGRWVIYGAAHDEPTKERTAAGDVNPLDEVQPSIWQHLPGRPPE